MKTVKNGKIGTHGADNGRRRIYAGERVAVRRRAKAKGMIVFLMVLILLTACAGKTRTMGANTPEEAAERTMEAIKALDLTTFNACTDNYEGTRQNLIGIPVEKEYKVFNELLQPHIFKGRRYKEDCRFAERVVEELSWKIKEIQEEEGGNQARIKMVLSNKDLSEAIGRYTLWIVEDMIDDVGIGAASFIKNVSDMVNYRDDDLIRCIDETENIWTEEIVVTAYKEEGGWKLHLTDEFINAFMGNINSEKYPEEIEERFKDLEAAYEEKAVQWADEVERLFE